jgi:hypothetical protein
VAVFRRIVLLVATTSAIVVLAPASAGAKSAPGAAWGPSTKTLNVRLHVDKFISRGGRLAAAGRANATLIDPFSGQRIQRRARVVFSVSRGATCNILYLQLDKLDLTLLGLNVYLDKVKLSVTGKRAGGLLGSLFCTIAAQRVALPRALRAANAALKRGRIAPMAFSVPVRPPAQSSGGRKYQAQPAPANTCPVLSLILGPLHLELLGLVVDLNQVKLKITAYRGQGALGDLFCGLGQKQSA